MTGVIFNEKQMHETLDAFVEPAYHKAALAVLIERGRAWRDKYGEVTPEVWRTDPPHPVPTKATVVARWVCKTCGLVMEQTRNGIDANLQSLMRKHMIGHNPTMAYASWLYIWAQFAKEELK